MDTGYVPVILQYPLGNEGDASVPYGGLVLAVKPW